MMPAQFDLLSDEPAFDQLTGAQRRHKHKDIRGNNNADSPLGIGGSDEETALRRLNIDTGRRLDAYYRLEEFGDDDPDWVKQPEFPTEYEISCLKEDGVYQAQYNLIPENRLTRGYDSVEEYLRTQYELLREDAVSTLREAVEDMTPSPHQMEGQSLKKAHIYNRVSLGYSLHHLC